MKKLILGILMLLTTIGYGQIELEHNYGQGNAIRVKLTNSGEKYYLYDDEDGQLKIYNADHTLWKSIDIPGAETALSVNVTHVSETKINPDNQIEITVAILDEETFEYTAYVMNESGNILLSIDGATYIELSEIEGLQNKLLVNNTILDASSVYSIPDLTLENTYDESRSIYRTKLENSGEKYYLFNGISQEAKIYNANHTLWKTIPLQIEEGWFFNVFTHISENKIMADDQIEIAYTTFIIVGGLTYRSLIVNESGSILLEVDGAFNIVTSEIDGLQNKCIASDGNTFSEVYAIPGLMLENIYDNGAVSRVKLENSGEKYYLFDESSGNAKVYNSDHTLWKTIDLIPANNATVSSIHHLSEDKIITDNQIEVIYSYTFSNGAISSKIINEDGTVLLTITNSSIVYVSEIEELDNKIMALRIATPIITRVYGVSEIVSIEENNIEEKVSIYPNPTTDYVTISKTANRQFDKLIIQTINGKEALTINNPSVDDRIDLSIIQSGIYFLTAYKDSKTVFVKKLIIQ